MNNYRLAFTFGLLALISLAPVSIASTLYGIEFSTGTGFYTVNQSTGAIHLVGNTGNKATGDLTSDQSSTIWTNDMTNSALLTVNPATGAISSSATIRSVTGAPVPIVSLAWDPANHNLYGNTAVGFGDINADQLFQIDPITGAASLIGTIGFTRVYALGFDQTGKLFGISNTSADLINISIGTGVGSLIAPVTLTGAFDLAFRPEDNKMFVADSGSFSLYTMNPATGASTLVGGYGAGSTNNVVGLAFLGAVPEPGTIGLVLCGLALVGLGAGTRLRS